MKVAIDSMRRKVMDTMLDAPLEMRSEFNRMSEGPEWNSFCERCLRVAEDPFWTLSQSPRLLGYVKTRPLMNLSFVSMDEGSPVVLVAQRKRASRLAPGTVEAGPGVIQTPEIFGGDQIVSHTIYRMGFVSKGELSYWYDWNSLPYPGGICPPDATVKNVIDAILSEEMKEFDALVEDILSQFRSAYPEGDLAKWESFKGPCPPLLNDRVKRAILNGEAR